MRVALGTSAIVFLCSSAVAGVSRDSEIERARQCAIQGDHDCSFGILVQLAEDGDLGLEIDRHQSLSGAMLEASLIEGFASWSAEKSRSAADRYLSVLEQHAPNSTEGYATAHGVIAMSCEAAGDRECAEKSIAALCAGAERLTAPMGDHPKYAKFTGQLIELLNNECGAPQ